MKTNLLEFNNIDGKILRGILVDGENNNRENIVLMMAGFERAGTTEKKFKALADKLAENKIDSFRFDVADCGLSDGDFYHMSTQSLADDLSVAVNLSLNLGYKRVSVVVHSLAACALSLLLDKISFEKIILIAPALNQKELLRLWFARINNKTVAIDWQNFRNYYTEDEFVENLRYDFTTKSHILSSEYMIKNQNIDYSVYYNRYNQENILLIQGMKDDKVPFESLNINFRNQVLIDNGDHDLERPDLIKQWIDKAIAFLK